MDISAIILFWILLGIPMFLVAALLTRLWRWRILIAAVWLAVFIYLYSIAMENLRIAIYFQQHGRPPP